MPKANDMELQRLREQADAREDEMLRLREENEQLRALNRPGWLGPDKLQQRADIMHIGGVERCDITFPRFTCINQIDAAPCETGPLQCY